MLNITTEDDLGYSFKFFIEDQENVPIDTIIMIATRAAIGTLLTKSPSKTTRIRRNTSRKSGSAKRLAAAAAQAVVAKQEGAGVLDAAVEHRILTRSNNILVRSGGIRFAG